MSRKTKHYIFRTVTGVLFAFFGVLVSAKDNLVTRVDLINGIYAALVYLRGVADKNPGDIREEDDRTRATDPKP